MSRLHVRSWPVDLEHPLVDHLDDDHGLAWLQHDRGLVGSGTAWRVDGGSGTDRATSLADAFSAVAADASIDDQVGIPGSGLVGFATVTFDPRSPGTRLVVPELIVGRHGERSFVTRVDVEPLPSAPPELYPSVADTDPVDRPRFAGSSMPDVNWLEAVAAALRRIEEGDVTKVVLARDHAIWAKVAFSPKRLTTRLTRRFPGCFSFVVEGLVGATPELLVSRIGRAVTSRTLAGTAPRGGDTAEDDRLAAGLLASDKDRREHALAAGTVEEVLTTRCATLEAEAEPHVVRLDNVMHLGTWFRGELPANDRSSALDLAAALHPTAAVGGVPTPAAVELIRELEGMDRGRYAGPVGWVDANGDGEFGIALRCAELSGARARLFAGAGIVAGSLPEDELEETRVKLLAMQSAFAP